MRVAILCGGKGTRMGKGLEGLPKALIRIGDKPIIWHIMKYYSLFGLNDFILCLGYKGNDIVKFFKNRNEFKIKFLDTGLTTNTGGRVKQIKRFIGSDIFFTTYGDGLSDINLKNLLNFHKAHKKTATLTAVRPRLNFGVMGIDSSSNLITRFEEKPLSERWVNGGFFVFNRRIFDYLKEEDILEKDTFARLVKVRESMAYKHYGFWECMDTYKDNLRLNQLWLSSKAPWALWKGIKKHE